MSTIYNYMKYEKLVDDILAEKAKPAELLSDLHLDSYDMDETMSIFGYCKRSFCKMIVGPHGDETLHSEGLIDDDGNVTDKGRMTAYLELWSEDKCPVTYPTYDLKRRPKDREQFFVVSQEDFHRLVNIAYCYRHELTAEEVAKENGLVSISDEVVFRSYELYGRDVSHNKVMTYFDTWKYGTEEETLDRIPIKKVKGLEV